MNDGQVNGLEVNEGEVNEAKVGGVEVNVAEVNDGEVNGVDLTNIEGERSDFVLIGNEFNDDSDDMSFH